MPVAIVTGASRGIGRAIALQLADDGYDLMINDIVRQVSQLRGVQAEVEAKGRKCMTAIADISVEDEVKDMIKQTVDKFGELNAMIANAGIVATTRLLETTTEAFDNIYATNVRGTFLCYRESAAQMITQSPGPHGIRGVIIGAASIAAWRPSGNTLPYTATKWAVRGLTQSTALDLAEYGIRVNAYCPGPVDTEMWGEIEKSVFQREGGEGQVVGEAFKASVRVRSALKKASEPEDIANLVSFLVSDKAKNITGQSMICDGESLPLASNPLNDDHQKNPNRTKPNQTTNHNSNDNMSTTTHPTRETVLILDASVNIVVSVIIASLRTNRAVLAVIHK